jgi:propionyl-CoA carboxylase alpha chain
MIDGEPLTVKIERNRGHWKLTARGASHRVRIYRPAVAQLAKYMLKKVPPDMSRFLLAPMPGLLTRLHVKPGDKVEAGQPLAVVEAMKMENILRAERAGTVKAANFAAGDSMAVDAAILEFE